MRRPEQDGRAKPGSRPADGPEQAAAEDVQETGGGKPPASTEAQEWKAKAAENYDMFLRARADYDNLARRTQRDVAMLVRLGKRDLLLKLLELADNLERATSSWRTTLSGVTGADPEALIGGVEMIGRQLQGILDAEGVKPIDSVGQAFDPAVHDCVATWDNPAVDCPTVTDEIKRGYTFDGEVLRAAQVRVAKP